MSLFVREGQKKGIGRIEYEKNYLEALSAISVYDALPTNLPTLTAPNTAIPEGMLTNLMSRTIEIFTARRSAEEVMGSKQKVMEWEEMAGAFPVIEKTGGVDPYSDFGRPRGVGMNANWVRLNQYRFTTNIEVGDLMAAQYAKARLNYVSIKNASAAESLAIEFNRIAWNGVATNTALEVYGMLNHPNLKPYETIAVSWDNASYDQIKADIAKLIDVLQEQSGDNVNTESDKIKIALPPSKLTYLKLSTNEMGFQLLDLLKKAFPNIEFISAPELKKAYTGGKDVLIMQAFNSVGGTDENGVLGFSELGRMSRMVMQTNGYNQEMQGGSSGYTPFKPTHIVRAQGV